MNTLSLPTRIDRVTVHANGAVVTRTGSLPAGTALPLRLELAPLPLLLAEDTLRLRIAGESGLFLGPVQSLPEIEVEGVLEPRLDEQIAEKERERIRLLHRWLALVELERAHGALRVPSRPDLADDAPVVDPAPGIWAALTDTGHEGGARLSEERMRLEEQLRQHQREIDRLRVQRDLGARGWDPARASRRLRTTLQGAARIERDLAIELDYFVEAARWVPIYTLKLGAASSEGELRLDALVAQASGEDWRGVAVSVSTADLRRETRLPELRGWRLGRRQAPPASGWRPLPEDLDQLYADADPLSGRKPAPYRATGTTAALAAADRLVADLGPPRAAIQSLLPDETPRGSAALRKQRTVEPAPESAPQPVPPPQARPAPMPPGAPPPMQAAMPAAMPASMSMPMSARARRSAGPLGGLMDAMAGGEDLLEDAGAEMARGGGGPPQPLPPPPPDPDRLLDYAWLRLPPWTDRGRRGRLWPVDLQSDLKALVEERGADAAQVEAIEAALRAQREALQRLQARPLPPGTAPVGESSFHHRYPAGPRVDVPSDGQEHRVAVASGRGPASRIYRVVPRQSTQVFRYVLAGNLLQAPLPPGPLRIYEDGAFVASSRLASTGGAGRLRLNLGVEERLRVARNTGYRESTTGMISTEHVLEHKVQLELRSRLSQPARVELYERLPRPQDTERDVSVKLVAANPQPATRDRDPDDHPAPGALRWEIELAPGATSTLSWTYVIQLPSKREILGGNRREP